MSNKIISEFLNKDEFSKKFIKPNKITVVSIGDINSSKYDDEYYFYITFKSYDDCYCDWFFKLPVLNDNAIVTGGSELSKLINLFYDIPSVAKIPFNEIINNLTNKSFTAKVEKVPYNKGFYYNMIPVEACS